MVPKVTRQANDRTAIWDQQNIGAQLQDGVLTLTLKKVKEAIPKRITIS
jgi:HSP20 family molecular chaperone IbpA